jgi:hypothetical protein
MPRYLTEQDIADFRNELCKVATERFARHGYEGVTMRQLAEKGAIDADPVVFGWSMWAALHGVVMLHQSGMLAHGPDYKTLSSFLGSTMLRGAAGGSAGKRRKK